MVLRSKRTVILCFLLILLALAGCQDDPAPVTPSPVATLVAPTPVAPTLAAPAIEPEATLQDLMLRVTEVVVTVTTTPTSLPPSATLVAPTPVAPTPVPQPQELVVCFTREPETLYLYGGLRTEERHIQHGLMENLFTHLNYEFQPQGLVKLPSLEDGDARLRRVRVDEGAMVVDAAGNVVRLLPGVVIRDADGDIFEYEEGSVALNELQVEFTLQPMVWSDGTPVTAADSVYSFQLAVDPVSRSDRAKVERTARYEATGEYSVQWTGVPGWEDPQYFRNVWAPVPRHQWERYGASGLLTAVESTRQPLSYGPFMIDEWVNGDYLRLVANPFYYRAEAGFPAVDSVLFRFMADTTAVATAVAAGECHIAPAGAVETADIPQWQEAEAAGTAVLHTRPGVVFEQIAFGIDHTFPGWQEIPEWFVDVRVRQALVQCTDRARMVDDLLFGLPPTLDSYVLPDHPLHPEDTAVWAYDPDAANALLDEVGWLDSDEDGVRENEAGEPFQITLLTMDVENIRPQVAELFKEDVAQCGVVVELSFIDPGTFFTEGPLGPIFGRQFDLALFAWLLDEQPPCHLYASANIPGPVADGFGGWDNVNVSGWQNEAFDAACEAGRTSFWETEAYRDSHQTALRLFADNVPAIPLFSRLQTAVSHPDVVSYGLDATQPSSLWNLFEIGLEANN